MRAFLWKHDNISSLKKKHTHQHQRFVFSFFFFFYSPLAMTRRLTNASMSRDDLITNGGKRNAAEVKSV